jgi:hypothetical protein
MNLSDAVSQLLPVFRKQVGPAVWLFMLLAQHAPADWTWEKAVYAAGGNVVSDADALRVRKTPTKSETCDVETTAVPERCRGVQK